MLMLGVMVGNHRTLGEWDTGGLMQIGCWCKESDAIQWSHFGLHRDGAGQEAGSQLLLQLQDHAFQLPLLTLILRCSLLQLQLQPPVLRLQVLQLRLAKTHQLLQVSLPSRAAPAQPGLPKGSQLGSHLGPCLHHAHLPAPRLTHLLRIDNAKLLFHLVPLAVPTVLVGDERQVGVLRRVVLAGAALRTVPLLLIRQVVVA